MNALLDLQNSETEIKFLSVEGVGNRIHWRSREKNKADYNHKQDKIRFMWFGKIAYVHGRTRVLF